jgi:PAS domain S-box-containing protein
MALLKKNFFHAVPDSLPMHIVVIDRDHHVIWLNKTAMEDLNVKSFKKVQKKKCFELLFGKKGMCEGCPLPIVREERKLMTSVFEDTESGRFMKIFIVPLLTGEKLHSMDELYVEVVQDITDQKKAEEELRKLSDFNAAIIKNAPVAIFTIDKTGKFMSVNPALAVISGLGEEAEKKLLKFNWLQNQYTINSGLADYIRRGLEGESFELQDFPFTNYRGDRGQYLHFRGVPIRDKEGNVECLLCIIEETTEKVMARIQSIQDAKMSVIGRLMTAVAHELNNPLASIAANSEFVCELFEEMKKEYNDERMDEIHQSLEAIQRESFRCKKIIRDMLDLRKKEGFEFKKIDLPSLIEEVLARFDFANLNVDVSLSADNDIPPVMGDVNALNQCFSNLIQNALDAVEKREKGMITLKVTKGNGEVIVEIEDNGVGIHESLIDRIFEPFFSTKNDGKGIGLGLTLCYEFLKRMGGKIDVKSTLGKGSLFRVILPATKES